MPTNTPPTAAAAPPGLPLLTTGRHRNPQHGTCLMEYVSVLAGLRFSDSPRCTHPLLIWLAQRVNDAVSDTIRPQLVTIAPELIGTRIRDSRVRAVIYAELARIGLGADPADRWLHTMGELAGRQLARRAPAQHPGPRPPCWSQPLLTIDRNYAWHAVRVAVAGLDPADRDRRLLTLLTAAAVGCRHQLGLPVSTSLITTLTAQPPTTTRPAGRTERPPTC